MIADSRTRVADNTTDAARFQIRRETERSVAYYAAHPEQIEDRLRELDEEWDVERALETGASALTLAGLALGIGVSRKWLLLSLVVQGFFMQHALQGWCPPLPLFRALGVRTVEEIDQERYALKALRGDFGEAAESGQSPSKALRAVRQ